MWTITNIPISYIEKKGSKLLHGFTGQIILLLLEISWNIYANNIINEMNIYANDIN